MQKKAKDKIKCNNCGHDFFLKMYNVWVEKIQLDKDYNEIQITVVKTHLFDTVCAKCREHIEY